MDKVSGIFGFMCKQSYQEQLLRVVENPSYMEVTRMESKAEIVQRINAMAVQFGVVSKEDYERTDEEGNFTSRPKPLSVLYLMLKLHKKDKVGSRAVAGGSFVPTTGISQVLSRALRLCIPVCILCSNI